jgi:glutamate 5-kinase
MAGGMEGIGTLVVKIGTSSIMKSDRTIDKNVLRSFTDDVAELWKQGKRVAIVTSGARGLGLRLNVERDPRTAAMVGMPRLTRAYDELFEWHGIETGQLLLTKKEFDNGASRRRTIERIKDAFANRIVPIINENDPITTLSTTLGDNDALAAMIACGIRADALVMLSMENGEFKGAGGSKAKVEAIRTVQAAGIQAFVINGKQEHSLRMLFDGDQSGIANVQKLKALRRGATSNRSKNRG